MLINPIFAVLNIINVRSDSLCNNNLWMSDIWLARFFGMRAGSSVGIATSYGLGDPRSNPGGGEIFAPVQTGPGAHPASCTMGTGSFPGVKSCRGVTLTTHSFYCRGQERVELYTYSPYGPYGLYRASMPVQGCTLPFFTFFGIVCAHLLTSFTELWCVEDFMSFIA